MPKTISDSTGADVEFYTKDELQAQKDAALEEFKKANPDKSQELTAIQEELDKLKGKDMNFANLRAQKEAAEKKVEDILKGVDEKISTVKKEVLEGVMKDHYNDVMKRLSGGDEELAKKIEFQYKRLGDNAGTKEEVATKLGDAYVLATGNAKPGIGQSPFSSGGATGIKIENKTQLSSEESELVKRMAAAGGMKLEDKDLK